MGNMFSKDDTTFEDIQDKSYNQWLDEMEKHDDVAVRCGVKLARDYVYLLKKKIENLQHENEVKEDYLKRLSDKIRKGKG